MAEDELVLTTARKPRVIVIDGIRYPIKDRDQMEFAEIIGMRETIDALKLYWDGKLGKDEAENLTDGLGQIIKKIMSAPDEVHAKLTDAQRTSILSSFLQAPTESAGQGPASPISPNSVGSTVAA